LSSLRRKEIVAAPQLGRAQLEEKDREDLAQIATALGIKGVAKAEKSALIEKILEETMAPEPKEPTQKPTSRSSTSRTNTGSGSITGSGSNSGSGSTTPIGAGGEPLSEWEIELAEHEGTPIAPEARVEGESRGRDRGDRNDRGDRGDRGYRDRNFNDGGGRNRRRRGRRRGGGRDEGPQGDDRYELEQIDSNEPVSTEPVKVEGYLDLRDEGYGFLRIGGYLPTRNDAYVSVRFTRQYGLRKGDHITGLSRPAGRNEKNPALLEVYTVNGGEPEKARNRKKFEDLTPLFPDEKLGLSTSGDPLNMTARIIDLISPIGKGQRGIIVSPPKAGKTTVMKTIATSIEKNHPEVKLIVLLIDERPEEVTDMRRTVKGEVIASTFDRPSDEHTQVAELAIEKAKRMVEAGEDVVVILDGITRLSRAYNLAAPATGRIMSGGIDAGALYPPKKFFGAARNIEEGGSLTILATALVETNSRMDEAIFEEFKGTGNMELRLDRRLAERRIYPAIDVDASSTRHEELLFDRKQLQMVWKLRRVLSGLAADGNAAPGLELLIDRLKSFKTNDEFLSEIAKQPTA
jgi:transcription termination factor Rho